VIGATGNVGVATLEALAADPAVTSIVGVARRIPDLELDRVQWAAADIDSDPLDVVEGADAVVHLAWKIQPQHDHATMYRTNVSGTQRVVDAATAHRVPALVVASSIGAYAPGPKQPSVDETWPTTGVPSSVYSRHKAAVERLLDRAEAAAPDMRIVRMRTSLVFQRRAASEIHRVFLGPFAPWHLPKPLRVVPRSEQLTVQATHASDVGRAYAAAVVRNVHGAFNIAAEPVLTPSIIAEAVGARLAPVPVAALRAAAALSFHLHLQPSEPGWIDMAVSVPTMDTTRARDELGWQAKMSATSALTELLAGIGDGAGTATPPLHARRQPARR